MISAAGRKFYCCCQTAADKERTQKTVLTVENKITNYKLFNRNQLFSIKQLQILVKNLIFSPQSTFFNYSISFFKQPKKTLSLFTFIDNNNYNKRQLKKLLKQKCSLCTETLRAKVSFGLAHCLGHSVEFLHLGRKRGELLAKGGQRFADG